MEFEITTENSVYRVIDSGDGKVSAKRIKTNNQYGVNPLSEPSCPGVVWKKGENGELLVLDEKGRPTLRTTKIIKTVEKE